MVNALLNLLLTAKLNFSLKIQLQYFSSLSVFKNLKKLCLISCNNIKCLHARVTET